MKTFTNQFFSLSEIKERFDAVMVILTTISYTELKRLQQELLQTLFEMAIVHENKRISTSEFNDYTQLVKNYQIKTDLEIEKRVLPFVDMTQEITRFCKEKEKFSKFELELLEKSITAYVLERKEQRDNSQLEDKDMVFEKILTVYQAYAREIHLQLLKLEAPEHKAIYSFYTEEDIIELHDLPTELDLLLENYQMEQAMNNILEDFDA